MKMKTGDYVLIADGIDDVFDGQLCKVMSPDEDSSPHEYRQSDQVPVLCWTGYMVWTKFDNLIPITCETRETEALFKRGFSRSVSATLSF